MLGRFPCHTMAQHFVPYPVPYSGTAHSCHTRAAGSCHTLHWRWQSVVAENLVPYLCLYSDLKRKFFHSREPYPCHTRAIPPTRFGQTMSVARLLSTAQGSVAWLCVSSLAFFASQAQQEIVTRQPASRTTSPDHGTRGPCHTRAIPRPGYGTKVPCHTRAIPQCRDNPRERANKFIAIYIYIYVCTHYMLKTGR